jgi:hypothetical protein
MKRWIICLFFVATSALAQTLITKVIRLHYLSADQALQLIQPLISADEQVSGSEQTLVLKVSPSTLTDIRMVLKETDVPPVTFTITVYQGDPNWLKTQGTEVIYSTNQHIQSPSSQSVSVMNGQTALVSMDNQLPRVRSVGFGYPRVIYQQYHVQTGLLVRPVLQGSQVQLSVRRLRQQLNGAGGQQLAEQQIDTTVMAPINKWISLGTTDGTGINNDSSTIYSTRGSFRKNSTLYIKVSIVSAVPESQ